MSIGDGALLAIAIAVGIVVAGAVSHNIEKGRTLERRANAIIQLLDKQLVTIIEWSTKWHDYRQRSGKVLVTIAGDGWQHIFGWPESGCEDITDIPPEVVAVFLKDGISISPDVTLLELLAEKMERNNCFAVYIRSNRPWESFGLIRRKKPRLLDVA